MREQTLNQRVEQQLESLRREFEEAIPPTRVTSLGAAQFDRLRADARIVDFLPVLVYRYTREELRSMTRVNLDRAA